MRIVQASLEDLKSIYDINKQLHLPIKAYPWDKKYWIREEIKQGSFYVLRNRSVFGAMCLQLDIEDENEANIETIAIRSDKQKRGFGRQLVNFAIEKAKEQKKSILTVLSFCEHNAKDFYLKCGFQLEEGLGSYYQYPYYSFFMRL